MNRKVKFKQWIPIEFNQAENCSKKQVEGTGCFESDFLTDGIFHQWCVTHEEYSNGAAELTVAIVELPDGTIQQVLPNNLRFCQPFN